MLRASSGGSSKGGGGYKGGGRKGGGESGGMGGAVGGGVAGGVVGGIIGGGIVRGCLPLTYCPPYTHSYNSTTLSAGSHFCVSTFVLFLSFLALILMFHPH
ncbi:hypothetical protein TSUD_260260 [Trifolium subterraneum]|uniref:Uncharacterized protein n=1 Tax=Trifolium subterraneum TaxID=3900 RepID=A0A2Z6MK14_TRISU|nr:hypothetical protein TSUD_260260 [Trifolium subterraneum]